MPKIKIIVFDLDETLRTCPSSIKCLPEDITKQENWNKWQEYVNEFGTVHQLGADVLRIMKLNEKDCKFILCTSSSFGTQKWLSDNNLDVFDKIIERQKGDDRSSMDYKIQHMTKILSNNEIKYWVDDHKKICQYASDLGIKIWII